MAQPERIQRLALAMRVFTPVLIGPGERRLEGQVTFGGVTFWPRISSVVCTHTVWEGM